ncbi:MAG: transposase [Dehalococcoidia bacterium]
MQAVSIIHMRKMRKTEPNDFADWDGTPLCLGGQAMTFLGYTPDLKLKYRCPTGGCQLRDRQGVLYCDTALVVDPLDDLRRFSLVPRNSPQWTALYSTRQSVERCFSRLKQHRALNDHCRRGLRKVALHALLGLVSVQAAALARILSGESERLRAVTRQVA